MWLLIIVLFAVYFFPSVLADVRRHQHRKLIFLANFIGGIFLVSLFWPGGALLCWLAAFVWACTAVRPQTVYVRRESGHE
jgi:drug/metabolite transporter (DMT)-like permease